MKNIIEKKRIVICTTIPDTILYILKGQPYFLSQYFDVYIFTAKSSKCDLINKLEGVKVYQLNFVRKINIIHDLISLFQMIYYLTIIKPDILHSYTPKAGLISMLSGWLVRIPVRIHTFTGLIFPSKHGFFKKLLIFFDRITCFFATEILPEGQGVKKDLLVNRITSKNLNIIGNGNISGIDTSFYNDEEVQFQDAINICNLSHFEINDYFVFCFIGRLNPDKGLNELYSAFNKISTKSILLIAGEIDDVLDSDFIELLNDMKKNNKIYFLGFLNDVRQVLKISNILLLPSYREGFPNVVLQAMSMKVPVIASNINGCNEIIQHNYNGWLIEPRNHEDLLSKMNFVTQIDINYMDKVKSLCRLTIEEKFEQKIYRKNLLNYYYSLL
jgi:glycosyltransferase involved in cell wall biosynthesis